MELVCSTVAHHPPYSIECFHNMNTVTYILLVSTVTHVISLNQSSYCAQDMSEAMFQASTVVLAKVKTIKRTSSGMDLNIRISKVIKSDLGNPVKPKMKLKVHHKHQFCKPVKVKRKYIFSLQYSVGKWHVECRPVTASKKIKRMMQHLFCEQCGKGPSVKEISNKNNVKINRQLFEQQQKHSNLSYLF